MGKKGAIVGLGIMGGIFGEIFSPKSSGKSPLPSCYDDVFDAFQIICENV